jgi:hypothetical protein
MKKFTSPFVVIKNSYQIFIKKDNFLSLIKIYSPIGFLSLLSLLFIYIPFLFDFFNTPSGNVAMGIFNFIFIFLAIFINLAGVTAIIKIVDGEIVKIKEIFKESASKFWKFLLLSTIIYLIDILGLLLLVFPFILVLTWFIFSKFIMIDQGTGIKKSLVQSKKMVKGKFWKVLLRIVIFGLFSLCFQMVVTLIPYGAGTVIFYLGGAFFILPLFLFYREISQETINE